MLQKLVKIKNYLTLQCVSIKLNIFAPKLYKINLINFLLVVYTNLKNHTIKIADIQWGLSFAVTAYIYLLPFYCMFEITFWFVLKDV